ncbi:MAG: glycosyltransferase family A protein [Pseudomonadota bacterium]
MNLSVILPCFNGAATLDVQLQALTRQHWDAGWELVVVNNGSTDGSMDLVERYRGRIPVLSIVHAHIPGTRRLGVPHSYNVGIQAARGDAFVFCEADDEVAEGWLTAMGEALAQHDFVCARLDHRKLNPEWLHPAEGDGYQSAGLSKLEGHTGYAHASGCSFGMRRSLYERVGPLNTDFPFAHDTEYSWRVQSAGYALHFEPEALIHYREKTALRARFIQGKNWGRDATRLTCHYGESLGRFALLRQLVGMTRALPRGARAWLSYASGRPKGGWLLAEWVWSMGWSMGRLQAIGEGAVPARRQGLSGPAADSTLFAPTESADRAAP